MGDYSYSEHIEIFGGPPEPGEAYPDLEQVDLLRKEQKENPPAVPAPDVPVEPPAASPDERLREAGDAALEAEVWFRCPDTAELWRFAQALPDPADGSDRVPPPEGRQNMVLTWHGPAEGEPWQAAFDNGIGQATMVVEKAREQGIDVHVYAVRVGPVDGEYQPQVDALAAADREAPDEESQR